MIQLYHGGDLEQAMCDKTNMHMAHYMTGQGLTRALAQLVIGLNDMHALNIAHRDIKLSNVFLSERSHLVLGDFGASKEIDNQATTFAGTPLTMAPEVLRRAPYNLKSDIYSLGATMYELCTHKAYMSANTIESLIIKVS